MAMIEYDPVLIDTTAGNVPVIVGVVPLFHVTSFRLEEGYKTSSVANSEWVQMIRPTTKKVAIEALLVGGFRAYRPLLEAVALTSRALASAVGWLSQVTGIPVVCKTFVMLDMQITSLTFVQDNTQRDTLKVSISLTHVPRGMITEALSAGADLALGAGSAFI